MTVSSRVARALAQRFSEREGLSPAAATALERELERELRAERVVSIDRDEMGVGAAVIDGRGRAWCVELAWSERQSCDALVHALADAARAEGATRLCSGGPPRWYLRSGTSDADEHRAWSALGARVVSDHRDARVALAGVQLVDGPVERVEQEREIDALARWVEGAFSEAWAREIEQAFREGSVFVAREGSSAGRVDAFAAHSGHAAARGTFGPLGTRVEARGRGLASRVARAALVDLRARGFESAWIPWIEPAVLPVYERIVGPIEAERRVLYALSLT